MENGLVGNIELNRIYQMDCLEGMKLIPDKSIDMILCDLPYGTTQNKWDSCINLEVLWVHYKRIIKDNGAIVLTAQTPFDKVLGCSNLEWLRYEWIWEKTTSTGHLNAKKMPMKSHENILVFYKHLPTYNPQKTFGHAPVHSYTKHQDDGSNYGKTKVGISGGGSTERYPRSVQVFSTDKQKEAYHPTQKPVALFEYLIKTYTNENEVVLDNCIGSGTTAVASVNTGRRFLGFEINPEYIAIANKRLEPKEQKPRRFSIMFNVNEIAKKVANGIVAKVDANTEDYLDTDFEDIGEIDNFIQQEIQDDLLDVLPENDYEKLSEVLMGHPEVLMAIDGAKIIVDDLKSDLKEQFRSSAEYYGLRQRDFI